MGKGSSPRNNHSKEWYSNYDDINWSQSESPALTDRQIELYMELERNAIAMTGPKLSKSQEATLLEHVRKAFKE